MRIQSIPAFLALGLGLAAAGCGSSGGGNDIDLTGTWTIQATLTSNTCSLPNVPLAAVDVTITQSGSRVTISGGGVTASGTLSGSGLSINNGTLNVVGATGCRISVVFNLNGSATMTQVTGTFSGTFTLDRATCGIGQSCMGTASFTMTRR